MMSIRRNLKNVSVRKVFDTVTDVRSSGRTINRMINQPSDGYNTNGTYIFEEDWDNLILLDSCRYDIFSDLIELTGILESRISRGSGTPEFIRGNFQGPDQLDTIYVSANGWYKKISEELGEHRSDLYIFDHVKTSQSKRDLGHVREECEKVTEHALSYARDNPNKRLIVHYMPPHRPYVNEDGDIVIDFENEHTMDTFCNLTHRSSGRPDHVTKKEIKSAYISSVEYILSHINQLVDELDGLTIISADHGEMLAERSRPIPIIERSHPRGVYIDQLVKVPWFILEGNDRRTIIEGDSPHNSFYESRKVTEETEEHLRDLGYKV